MPLTLPFPLKKYSKQILEGVVMLGNQAIKKIGLNGKLLSAATAKVSVLDRGFLYGDGVYEAVRIYDGKIFRARQHWQRLRVSLKSIFLKISWTDADLTRFCLQTARANNLKEAMVRLTISRGVGTVGYDPSSCKNPTLMILALPIRPDLPHLWKKGVMATLVSVRRNPIISLSPLIKHTNSLNGILAKIESLRTRAFEGIFLNTQGFLAEGTISNVFLVDKGTLKTPSLDCGILDGVTRGAVLECAKRLKISVVETQLLPKDLQQAQEVFLSSTTMEVMPVVRLGSQKIGGGLPGPITRKLQQELSKLICKELNLANNSANG